jgi:hypothetical protein
MIAHLPGFTAEASVYGAGSHYMFVNNHNRSSVTGVLPQMRLGVGGIRTGGTRQGFWDCVSCVAICTSSGSSLNCYDYCRDAGECKMWPGG